MASTSDVSLSLRTRITLCSLGISLAILWTLSYLASQRLRQEAEYSLRTLQFSTASILASQINHELKIRLDALQTVAALAPPAMAKGPAGIQSFLEQRFALLSLFKGSLFITNSAGIRIACTPFSQERIGSELIDRDYIRRALLDGETSIGKPIIARPYQTPVIAMATPIRDAHGKVIGALSGVIELSGPSFLDGILDSHYGNAGNYLLISREHRLVITATEKARVLNKLPEPGDILALDRFIEGYEGSQIHVDVSGEEIFATAKRIATGDWLLIATMPTSIAFAPYYAMQRFMLLSTLLLTLLAGALTWWMTQRQLKPLHVAANTLAEHSRKQQPFSPLPTHRKDEIGLLIDGFNQVLETLENRESALYETQSILQSALDQSPAGIVIADAPDGALRYVNDAGLAIRGQPRATVDYGISMRNVYSQCDILDLDMRPLEAEEFPIARAILYGETSSKTVIVRGMDGCERIVMSNAAPIKNKYGKITAGISISLDITDIKKAENEIKQLAFYDTLTGLPNRQLLRDRLQHALATRTRHQREGAVLFIDINHFQRINDSQGRELGDLLLRHMAQRLGSCVRDSDTVARVGPDQFVVLLEELSEDLALATRRTETIAEKIIAVLHKTYLLNETSVQCTVSIGAAMFESREDAEELLSGAELAMNTAKTAGMTPLRFFDPQMQAMVVAQATLEGDLRRALIRREFLLYYQVQMDAAGQPLGAEALLRWNHPSRGFVSPAAFIPMAEDTGLIVPLGQWVLETACRQLAAWAGQAKFAHLTLSVNVSARQFHHGNFVSQVLDALEKTQADPRRLKLELTEGSLLNDVESVIAKMALLKEKGVHFSLDDFGTGYSSLTYLKRLPLDQLKIDQSFIRDVLSDDDDAAITRTIVALGHSLGLEVIAEGVETCEQKDFLADSGCLIYQGYYFGRPLAADQFEQFIQTR